MSGGVAYVLDERGDFDRRCNLAMVELQPVAAEDAALESRAHQGGDLEHHGLVDVMRDMTRDDGQRVHALVARHAELTGSARAREILARWEHYLPKFVKVMPVDYRRALEKMSGTQSTGPRAAAGGH